MDRSDFCGCKGVRTCIKCEQKFGYENKNIVEFTEETYVYCPYCNKAWQGSDMYEYRSHPNHSGKSFPLDGVYIQEDFLSEEEAKVVMKQLDEMPWDRSQSGRKKQNFGPKCNFKRQKIKLGDFQGFPACTKFIQDRFHTEDVLKAFQTIEQCTLEYDSENGSSIDNHIDDCWIWGERIVTVNIVGDSVLTLTYYTGDNNKYNLGSACFSYNKKYTTFSPDLHESSLDNPELNTPADHNSTSNFTAVSLSTSNSKSTSDSCSDVTNGNSSDHDRIDAHGTSESVVKSITNGFSDDEKSCTTEILNGKTPSRLLETPSVSLNSSSDSQETRSVSAETLARVVIRIPMPAKSLLVLYGEARYEWQHCVLRSDVIGRRVCIAYREFTAPYVNCEATRDVFEKARRFF